MGKKNNNCIMEIGTKQVEEALLVEEIKRYLISEDGFGEYDSWEEFIDEQEMGDCQLIVSIIVSEFGNRGVKKVFGEIEVDEPSTYQEEEYDEDIDDYVEVERENFNFTHHWVEIEGEIFDFSKGTLKDNIYWEDLYDVYSGGDESRYVGISD